MDAIESHIRNKTDKIFPSPRYEVIITGKPSVFQKGTKYLLDNLLSSLLFAFFLTGGLVAVMFRSIKMVLVSIIPNLLPLLMTAGLMGFLGIPLKPSTLLVFGIAFGMSVDDTLRFLAQYRLELSRNDWKIKKSVFAAGARSDADSKPLFIAGRDDWQALAQRMGVGQALRVDADGSMDMTVAMRARLRD